ncbi:hypothetical protein AGMMS49975_00520 [Clostridia bacterium]|nr:hypothetical protein AGMMS49975_00520 [Clostridia bacterium]
MLKSYDFVKRNSLSANITDSALLARERELLEEFVKNNPPLGEATPCHMCGGETSFFAEIGGVTYRRCSRCFSVFAEVSPSVMEKYKAYEPLLAYYRDGGFQKTSSEKRGGVWDELLFWLNFRVNRYLAKKSVSVLDYGGIFYGLSERIQNAAFCETYRRRSNTLGDFNLSEEKSDVVLCLDALSGKINPEETLSGLKNSLKDGGILILSSRTGTGFDILTLRGRGIYPYKYVLLPSVSGLQIMLEKLGFEILEISTPGTLDVNYVMEYVKDSPEFNESNPFIGYMLGNSEPSTLWEFQSFLQKNGLSSFTRVIARKIV